MDATIKRSTAAQNSMASELKALKEVVKELSHDLNANKKGKSTTEQSTGEETAKKRGGSRS